MRDLVTSVAAGKIDEEYVIDLAGKEEDETACDMPVAWMPRDKKVTLLQLDGDLPAEDAKKVLDLAIKGCEEIYKKQKDALKKRWIG
jgi:exosome complex component RRP41